MYGSNLFIRKDVLDKIGGFDETTLTEDCDLGMKLISGNYGMKVDYSIKSYEQPAISMQDWWRQRVRWTWGGISVFKKYTKEDISNKVFDRERASRRSCSIRLALRACFSASC